MRGKVRRSKLANTRKGFTLIELMVTLSIIAILAAVALPNYTFYKEKAVIGKSINAGSKVLSGLEIYYNEVGSFNGLTLSDPEGGVLTVDDQFSGVILPKMPGVTWEMEVLSKERVCIKVCDTIYIGGIPVWKRCHTEYTKVKKDAATGIEIGFERVIFTDINNTYGFNVGEPPVSSFGSN